ncbi:MAG: rhodanese-like domain-containing protein [Alphaproteobacteria bacterium]|nr:rhodanese-like domain-containing protein [Alphaproteobacteria bacterium]
MGDALGNSGAYAGDISPREAWHILTETPAAQLLDVRTQAEWTYVGLPNLDGLGKKPALAEWQAFPDGARNPNFGAEAEASLARMGVTPGTPVVIICRSGARSRAAAIALTQRGYAQAFNIAGGFEGDHDENGHRGSVNGWKAEGLPWRQG